MANTRSAKKRIRQTIKRTFLNKGYKLKVKKLKKAIQKAIQNKEPKNKIQELLSQFYSIVDKTAKRNIFHKNKAARLKSRITKMVLKS